ncbi:MAG: hypothetical protein LBQ28_01595 [Prevotellaceae bacterium]|jgi:hypothetical protein|nr:hypothetical protein [Prevotellaceae bacterium]
MKERFYVLILCLPLHAYAQREAASINENRKLSVTDIPEVFGQINFL